MAGWLTTPSHTLHHNRPHEHHTRDSTRHIPLVHLRTTGTVHRLTGECHQPTNPQRPRGSRACLRFVHVYYWFDETQLQLDHRNKAQTTLCAPAARACQTRKERVYDLIDVAVCLYLFTNIILAARVFRYSCQILLEYCWFVCCLFFTSLLVFVGSNYGRELS